MITLQRFSCQWKIIKQGQTLNEMPRFLHVQGQTLIIKPRVP